LAQGATQPPAQCVPWIKQTGHDADHSSSSCKELQLCSAFASNLAQEEHHLLSVFHAVTPRAAVKAIPLLNVRI